MNSSFSKLQIRLPEGVLFSVPLAGPISRCFAFLLDIFIISALSTVFEQLMSPVRGLYQDLGTGLLIVFYLAAGILYFVLCEYFWFGQTMGKWLLSIRVMDSAGLRLQLYQVVVRNLIRTLDLLPALGLLGGTTMLCSRRLQRLGDLAAGTVVVKRQRVSEIVALELARGRYNSFARYHLLCAKLRQKTPAELGAVALDAIRRRDHLEDRARVRLFDELQTCFQSMMQFPPEDVEQLSSEQYVRNAVEILYRANSASATQRELHPAGHVPA